ncbi:helix-turn-helix domain-containing protein [Hellea sp.]|nr:helix-turn-helix domain-containing protein [Hellea sp.]
MGKNGSEIKIRFGARVRELRVLSDYSQEEFADKCELDRSYVGSIERGERNVSLINIVKISRALGVVPGELFR